jgi:hypothetical protein
MVMLARPTCCRSPPNTQRPLLNKLSRNGFRLQLKIQELHKAFNATYRAAGKSNHRLSDPRFGRFRKQNKIR